MTLESNLFSRPMQDIVLEDPRLHIKIVIFNVFTLLGVVVNAAVLIPAILLPHIKRTKSWFSLIISWILYSVSYLLLMGRQMESEPPFGLCIFQAAFTTSTTVVCIIASTCFTIDFALQMPTTSKHEADVNNKLANFLAFFPWIIFVVIFSLAQLIVPHSSMVIVDPSQLFCSINSRALHLTTGIIILVSAIILFLLEAYIAILFHRLSVMFPRKELPDNATISISSFIRLVVFTVVSATGIGVHSYNIARINNTVTTCSLILSFLPVLNGLVFGSTKDILQAWMCRKKPIPANNVRKYSDYDFITDPEK